MKIEIMNGLPASQIPFLAPLIEQAISEVTPEEAQASLGGLLGNVIGPIPDEFWDEMVKFSGEPCSTPGCTCHIAHKKVFDGFTELRKEWKRITSDDKPNPDEKGFSA